MSAPKKYENGFMHVSALLSTDKVRKFEEFCDHFGQTKTDVLDLCIDYICMSAADREETLKHVEFENLQLKSQIQILQNQIDLLRKKSKPKARSLQADKLIKNIKDDIRKGTVSPQALIFRCDELLRPFLKDKLIPDDQKQEITELINSFGGPA